MGGSAERRDLNLVRLFFFVIGVMTGASMVLWADAHRTTASTAKFYYNECPRMADGTSSCGLLPDDTH